MLTTFLSLVIALPLQESGEPVLLKTSREALEEDAATSVEAGLEWLRIHQDPGGHWSCAGFAGQDIFLDEDECDGAGQPIYDVGVTGLAVLAFLGDARLQSNEQLRSAVQRGVEYLLESQDGSTGLYGYPIPPASAYHQGIATMAVAEALHAGLVDRDDAMASLRKATQLILKVHAEDSAWGYFTDEPVAMGPFSRDEDGNEVYLANTATTAWNALALLAARDVGIDVDAGVLADVRGYLVSCSNRKTGATGYAKNAGYMTARPSGAVKKFPADLTPATAAMSLFLHPVLIEADEMKKLSQHPSAEFLEKQKDLIMSRLPSDAENAYEPYYWFFASQAAHQYSDDVEEDWQEALQRVVLGFQREDGNFAGSWDPRGPWGGQYGRVGSTALVVLALQAPERYQKVLE